jgi:outer membrane receptor protein involved in Fe transport
MSLMLALMQAAVAAAPVAEAQQGVTSYGPEFFAAQQPSTAVDMLNRIPGFTLDNGASVRGFEGAAGNVLIDGQRPASKTDSLQDILFRVPANKVERIDVIRGGAPGIDMQGKTVLANVVLKKDGGVRGVFAIADNRQDDGRHLGQVRVEGSGALGQVKWELSGRAARGIDDGAGAGRRVTLTPGSAPVLKSYDGEGDGLFYSGVGALETPLVGGQLRLNGRIVTDGFKYEEATRVLSTPPENQQYVYLQEQDDTEIGARYTRKFGEPWDLELVGLRSTRDRLTNDVFTTPTVASLLVVDRYTTETIGRAVLKYRANPRLSFEVGGETAVNTLDSATTFTNNGANIAVPAANVEVEEDRSEVFAKASWRPSSVWTLDAGLRFERSTISSEGDVTLEKTLQYLKPRLAVTWGPAPPTQVRLRLEREVDQLNFSDFVASGGLNSGGGVTAGNPDLNPGQAWVGEVAVEQRFWKSGSVALTYRHSELSDVVDRGPVTNGTSTFDRPENIGDGTKDVIALDLTLPFDRLGAKGALLKGNVTRRWSKVTDPTTGETRRQSFMRPLEWNATFSWDMPERKITWGADVFGAFEEKSYRFNLVRTFKLNTYVKPFIEYKPQPDLNIRLELPNVTRRNLHDTFQFYGGLRTAGAAPTSVDDKRTNQTPGGTFFRVRKTFG